ncbi:MAG: DNA-processing protein DprA [Anaerosomatales bacterium]|nr:DNA-processing protein DprA [Anaerosomatales bacterium]
MTSPERWQIAIDDPDYPEPLRDADRPPAVLYGYGDASLLCPGLAVIGSRKATPYGIVCARRFARWAAAQGIVIISGAAIGCDMAAHEAALEAGGRTIAVLACGADVDYPGRASSLLGELRAHHVVISEAPWGTEPRRWAFVARNRIIAGLARAVLVTEGGVKSGTFTTADFALDMGRDVWAVPGPVTSAESRGPNRLIRQGAVPITDESELRDALVSAGFAPRSGDSLTTVVHTRDALLRTLAANPMRPDDLVSVLHTDVVTISRCLAEFQLAGRVHRWPDGRYGVTPPQRPRRYNQRKEPTDSR